MKLVNFIAVSIVVVIAVVGIFQLSRQSKNMGDVALSPIQIGGAFALSGFAAEWGEADLNGARLAIEEINEGGGVNGRQIELAVEDTSSDGLQTVSAVQKLINIDEVEVIIGPTWLDTFTAAASLADQFEVVMIAPSASIKAVQSEKENEYVWSTWFRSDQESRDLVKYLGEAGEYRIALFFDLDPFWQDVAGIVSESANELGIDIVKDVKVSTTDVDFRTSLSQIKALNPDVIIFGFNNEKQLLTFLKQRVELYPGAQLISTESIGEFFNKEGYQQFLDGVRYIAPAVKTGSFEVTYRERFNKDPVFSASNSYDATRIILGAMAKGYMAGPAIKDYLNKNSFDTVTFGPTSFDDIGGVGASDFVIKLIEDGEVRELVQL